MRVVVVGMGEVGRHLADTMVREGHDVTAVDTDAHALVEVGERLDVATLVGWGSAPSVLERAGAGRADLVAAVTDADETNLVAALVARDLGARRTVARVQSKEYGQDGEGVMHGFLGIDVVVNPRVLVAREIARIARSHGALEVLGLAGNRVEVVQIELPARSRVLHRPLADLSLPNKTLVAAVVRDGELFVPGGADVLLPGDRVYLAGLASAMHETEGLMCGGREATRVCIVGGGVVGEALARALEPAHVHVTVIERDARKAEDLAERLPGVTVLHGDGTDAALLEEENMEAVDLFCALTHEDEVNLMSALLARRQGARRTASLVHRPHYVDIHRQLGIDVVLSPRLLASEHILRYLRRAELKSLFLLEEGQAEVLEFAVAEGARIVGPPLRRLNFPRGAILCALIRGNGVRIPRGDDEVRAGDTVVVLTTAGARREVERLFERRAL